MCWPRLTKTDQDEVYLTMGFLQQLTGMMFFAVCFSSCDLLYDKAWPFHFSLWGIQATLMSASEWGNIYIYIYMCHCGVIFFVQVLDGKDTRYYILDNGCHILLLNFSNNRQHSHSGPYESQTKTWTRLFPWLKAWDDDYTVAIEMLQMTKYCQWSIRDKVLHQMFHD